MKCPKCGFTSFDDLTECKKCAKDLSAFRSKFNLRGIVRPFAAAAPPAATPATPAETDRGDEPAVVAASGPAADPVDFGYDFMEETPGEPTSSLDDLLEADASAPFPAELDFDAEPPAQTQPRDAAPTDLLFDEKESAGEDAEKEEAYFDLDVDFNWDESAEKDEGGGQSEPADATAFDLPSLDALPSLDELDEEPLELDDFPDLPEFEDVEEDAQPAPKAKTEGDPRDPFDARGDADSGRPPAAPLAPRFRAALIDLAALSVVFALFVSAAELIVQGAPFPSAATFAPLIVPYALTLFLLCFGYFTLFHALTGQTLGKMVLGLKIEAIDGTPPLFSQVFLRAAGGALCLAPLGLGYLHLLRAADGRGLNDRLAGTVVVRVREETEETGAEMPAGA